MRSTNNGSKMNVTNSTKTKILKSIGKKIIVCKTQA